jgi:hypothetical protein
MAYHPPITDIALQRSVEDIVKTRDDILRQFNDGHKLILQAIKESESINTHSGIYIRNLPSPEKIKKEIDKKTWEHLFNLSGMGSLMNSTQKDEFKKQLKLDPPEVTIDRVKATLVTQYSCKDETFIEGMVDTFKQLDNSYKTNKPFKLGHKVIFSNASNKHGQWNSYSEHVQNMMIDLERIIFIINQRKPPEHGKTIVNKLYNYLSTADVVELDFMNCKTHQNGSVHIQITCEGTINKMNELIADHYGHSLPQG